MPEASFKVKGKSQQAKGSAMDPSGAHVLTVGSLIKYQLYWCAAPAPIQAPTRRTYSCRRCESRRCPSARRVCAGT